MALFSRTPFFVLAVMGLWWALAALPSAADDLVEADDGCFGLPDCGSGADEELLGDETVLLQTFTVLHRKRGRRATSDTDWRASSSPVVSLQDGLAPVAAAAVAEANTIDDVVSLR
mmetsp:Transcript_30643/g.77407  ORF Transcript_30643/g.77407 Transcript_30643/m.77407 type:complete len:116 (-) Transcript_30643:101-448(-)|eukprot:CAMPEP_0183542500 /NCGR_PEP_ID=MMETSP0371-20130417/42425_1 /TAXON_ID=268820 /ORGANISM="Peridinium aciculiferum, Strain PAER-2" /LENGTH=115 /DNA_ID=CAMNT_0025743759 /DNA_START=49 /DNA_END=396 /DNA_ORIENTATION=+